MKYNEGVLIIEKGDKLELKAYPKEQLKEGENLDPNIVHGDLQIDDKIKIEIWKLWE